MRLTILLSALFAAMAAAMPGLEHPQDPETRIVPDGCPGGGPGNACPYGLFQVSNRPSTRWLW